MYRKILPRIYELRDLLPLPAPPGAYFHDLDRTLAEIPQKLKQYRDIEADLQGLDPVAWTFLKSELQPLLTAKDPRRGWQSLFDKLNQAKAYSHLKGAGYCNIEFIPPSTVKGQQMPDLRAEREAVKALCEVKTINISEIESDRRHRGGVGSSSDRLDAGFFAKLQSDIEQAKKQMIAYDPDPKTKRLTYIVVKFDDALHEYSDAYRSQIDEFMASANRASESEVIFDIDPPLYGHGMKALKQRNGTNSAVPSISTMAGHSAYATDLTRGHAFRS